MEKFFEYLVSVISYVVWVFLIGIVCLILFIAYMSGTFTKPNIPLLQAEGEILLKAVYEYKAIHGRLPKDSDDILTDRHIPVEAKSLLRNPQQSRWRYGESRGEFFISRYTGRMGDSLRYMPEEDENGNKQYRWNVMNGK